MATLSIPDADSANALPLGTARFHYFYDVTKPLLRNVDDKIETLV